MYQSFNQYICLHIHVCIYFCIFLSLCIFPPICSSFISVSVSVRHIQKPLLENLKEQYVD